MKDTMTFTAVSKQGVGTWVVDTEESCWIIYHVNPQSGIGFFLSSLRDRIDSLGEVCAPVDKDGFVRVGNYAVIPSKYGVII